MILALTVSELAAPDDFPLHQPTGPDFAGNPDRVGLPELAGPTARPSPRGEDGARVGRAQARGAAELGGQQVDHPLAQVGERGVGAGDAEGRDRDDLAVGAQVSGAGAEPGQREHERGCDDAAGGQPAAAAGRVLSHRHGGGAFRRGPDGFERREHLVRALRPVRRTLLQEPHDEAGEPCRQTRPPLLDRHRRLGRVSRDQVLRRAAGEGGLPGKYLVADHAERVEIRAVVSGEVGHSLLGRHVGRRPEGEARRGQRPRLR